MQGGEGGVVPKANTFPKRRERGEAQALPIFSPARAVGDDVKAGPEVLELDELEQRVLHVGRVFDLEKGVGQAARVEPGNVNRLAVPQQGGVGERGKRRERTERSPAVPLCRFCAQAGTRAISVETFGTTNVPVRGKVIFSWQTTEP